MSVVLAVVVVAVVASAAARRRRPAPGRDAARIGAVDRFVRSALRATLATIAAGAVLLLFGQEVSAQADEAPEPPATAPTVADGEPLPADVEVAPEPSDPPGIEDETHPPAPPDVDEGTVVPAGADATAEPPPADPPSTPTPTGDAPSDVPLPTEPAAPPTPPAPTGAPTTAAAAEPPSASVAPPPPPPTTGSAETMVGPVDAPKPSNGGLWNVALTGRAWVRSNGDNISIRFDGGGPELMRPAAEISGLVITGSDGDDSLEVSDGLGVQVRYDGGRGIDALVMPSSGGTVRLTGSRAGELFDLLGALLVSFAGVDDIIGGPGTDTFVAERQSDLRSLEMGPEDRLVVELGSDDGGAPTADLLTIDSAKLAGTLEVSGGPSAGVVGSTSVPFLSFGTVEGDFTSFRGLDLGDGAYLRPATVAGGYELRPARLPDELAIHFPSAADADSFFTFLSGKGNAFTSGTLVTIQLGGHQLTGGLTVSGTPDAAVLTLRDARLRFGDADDEILVLEDDAATLTLTESNLSGRLNGPLTTTVPGVSFSGTFTIALDTNARSVVAIGNGVTVTIAGYTFSGVDLVVSVVGDGADMALRITGPTGVAVTIPRVGPSQLHIGVLAAAVGRDFGGSEAPRSAEAAIGDTHLNGQDGSQPIVGASESTAHSSAPPAISAPRRSVGHAGDAVVTVLHSVGPLLALAGVAGPLVVAASTSTARTGSSRAEPTPMAATIPVPPALVPPSSSRVLPAEPVALGGFTTAVSARGPPQGGGTAIASESLVRLTSSPQRTSGAQGPFPVTTTGRTAAASVESGRVDRAPGLLIPLFVLLHLLWTRGRRSTRPVRPCRRRARGSLLANGDAGGVTGGSWRRRRCGHRRRHALRGSQRAVPAGRSLRAAPVEGGRSAMSDEWSCAAHRSSRRGCSRSTIGVG